MAGFTFGPILGLSWFFGAFGIWMLSYIGDVHTKPIGRLLALIMFIVGFFACVVWANALVVRH